MLRNHTTQVKSVHSGPSKSPHQYYWQTSNISRTLLDSKIVDHSDVAPVGAALTTYLFLT